MKQTKTVEQAKYSINIKVSAKQEVYGEYTVKADTFEELETELEKVGALFIQHVR